VKKLVVARRASQVSFLIFFIYILWSNAYPLKGFFSPQVILKVDPLIVFFTSMSERVILKGVYLSLGMVAITFVFGRFFCGWMCPMGAIIDAVAAIRKRKLLLSDNSNARVRKPKFFIIVATALFSLFGIQIAWILDPIVIAARFISLNFIPLLTLLITSLFIVMIKSADFQGPVYDFYHYLKASFLGINIYYFSHSAIILAVFLIIVLSALFISRIWCRMLCPLGAFYAVLAKISPFKRTVEKCQNCRICMSRCRMGAIRKDISYVKSECILCMDCVYDCPQNKTKFKLAIKKNGKP